MCYRLAQGTRILARIDLLCATFSRPANVGTTADTGFTTIFSTNAPACAPHELWRDTVGRRGVDGGYFDLGLEQRELQE